MRSGGTRTYPRLILAARWTSSFPPTSGRSSRWRGSSRRRRSSRTPPTGTGSTASRASCSASWPSSASWASASRRSTAAPGADFLSYILVLEELSRADAGVGVTVAVHTSAVTLPILTFGTDEQRSRFVPPLARGEAIGAFALTEPEAGSDAGSLRTAAAADGDGWTITGHEAVDHERRLRRHRAAVRAHRSGDARREGRLGVRARRRPGARHARGGEARPQLLVDRRPGDRGRAGRARPAAARGGQGLLGRDGDARRRADRDRRAGARDRPGRLRRGTRVRARAAAVRQADRATSRRSSGSSPTWRRRSTRRGCSSTARRG